MPASRLPKNVLFLTKTLFTFLIVSLLIYLNFADLNENNRNRRYLNLLKGVAEKLDDSRLSFKDYELKRLDTLKNTDPGIYKKHEESRIALVKILNEYGALINASSKGIDENNSNPNNSILLMSNDALKSDIGASLTDLSAVLQKLPRPVYINLEEKTIGTALDLFNRFPATEKIELLTAVDTIALQQKCDSLLNLFVPKLVLGVDSLETATLPTENQTTTNSNRYRPGELDQGGGGIGFTNGPLPPRRPRGKHLLFRKSQTFNGLCIYNGHVLLSITDAGPFANRNSSFAQDGGQGQGAKSYVIFIPAQTATAASPSTLVLAGFPSATINELYDKNLQEALRDQYGNAKLSMIDDISIDSYKKNNAPISILGFDLSRKWFPIALFLVITILLFNLFLAIQKALSSSAAPKNTDDDDVLGFLVNSKLLRFFLWVLASPVIFFLVLSSSPVHYSRIVFYGLAFCCILSVVLGIVSYRRSLKL